MEKANDVPNANPPKIEKPKGKEALLVTPKPAITKRRPKKDAPTDERLKNSEQMVTVLRDMNATCFEALQEAKQARDLYFADLVKAKEQLALLGALPPTTCIE